MGKRFVAAIWIRQRMDRTDARINREIRQSLTEREKVRQHNASCDGTFQPPIMGIGADQLWVCDECSFAVEQLPPAITEK